MRVNSGRGNSSVCVKSSACRHGHLIAILKTHVKTPSTVAHSWNPSDGGQGDRQISGAQSPAIRTYIVISRLRRDPASNALKWAESKERHLSCILASTCTYKTHNSKTNLFPLARFYAFVLDQLATEPKGSGL